MLSSDIAPWEFDQRAVEPGQDVLTISDWHKRHGRANNKDGNIDKAAAEVVRPVRPRAALRHGR